MKKLFYLLVLLSSIANAQVVNIPDANFKARLISNGVDQNEDGQIQESEALAVQSMYLINANISDLTGIEAFTNITSLICYQNQITSLNVSGFTQLMTLDCSYNQITSINFTNCPILDNINCFNNLITSIDLTGLNTINFLHCMNNLISNVTISNPVRGDDFMFQNNQLVNLDLSRVQWLSPFATIELSNNPLQTLNLKNGNNESLSGGLILAGLTGTTLQYICEDENQVVALKNILITNYGNTTCEVNSYCTATPGGNYNTIVGNVKFDANNNGCDAADPNFPIRVNVNNGSGQWANYANSSGNYTVYLQTGNFTLTPALANPTWFTVTPPSATVNFANNLNNVVTRDFCIAANGVHHDVEVLVFSITPARPGYDAVYKIVVRNKGNQILNLPSALTLSFEDSLMDYVSSTQAVASQSSGLLTWDIMNLQPFENRNLEVTFNINAPTDTPPVNLDDMLDFTAIVTLPNDEEVFDNSFTLNQMVVGSFDPNDITCLEGAMVSPTEIGKYLHYNIRFENTGTAAAERIVVKMNVNPADYDIATLELLNASHIVDARVNGNTVEFVFSNINLGAGQHGNVLLKMKTKSNLVVGDEVNSQASIYFDYNFPVITNDAETVFQLLSNPDFEIDNSVTIYPNPSNGILNVKGKFNIKSTQLFDVQGRLLQSNIVNDTTAVIDLSSQSKGIYFVKVITDNGIKVEKLVKQ